MADLKDSGERRDFGTGAVRDSAEGKGRCDLLPLYVIGSLIDSEELKLIGKFKETKNPNFLLEAVREFSFKTDIDLPTIIIEVSKQFEDGAKKYTENNWMKGIPLHCYIDSGTRHFLKFLRGDKDEPHDRAFVWNMICGVWTFNNKPELDDIEKDLCKTVIQIQDEIRREAQEVIVNPDTSSFFNDYIESDFGTNQEQREEFTKTIVKRRRKYE